LVSRFLRATLELAPGRAVNAVGDQTVGCCVCLGDR
jgi:hypothetical protein